MGINKKTHLNLIIPGHCNHNLIIVIIFKLIAMIEEIHFILHVTNGIHITIQVKLFVYCTNTFFSKNNFIKQTN